MRLIVGLGNPGEKYENTRHNIGFLVVEKIAQMRGIVFRLEPHYKSRFAEMGEMDDRIKLVEPQTFMNESGQAVQLCKDYWKVDSEDIWIVHDDVDLEVGKVRIALGGSSAGHKGVQSIIDNLGTEQFWRVRVGVGRSDMIATEDYVLQKFTTDMTKIIDEMAGFVLESLNKGIESKNINIS